MMEQDLPIDGCSSQEERGGFEVRHENVCSYQSNLQNEEVEGLQRQEEDLLSLQDIAQNIIDRYWSAFDYKFRILNIMEQADNAAKFFRQKFQNTHIERLDGKSLTTAEENQIWFSMSVALLIDMMRTVTWTFLDYMHNVQPWDDFDRKAMEKIYRAAIENIFEVVNARHKLTDCQDASCKRFYLLYRNQPQDRKDER